MEKNNNIEKESKLNNSNDKKIGTIKDKYENVYEGEIIDGMANGQGTKTYKDGRVYTGLFKNNKREGKGILIRQMEQNILAIIKMMNRMVQE